MDHRPRGCVVASSWVAPRAWLLRDDRLLRKEVIHRCWKTLDIRRGKVLNDRMNLTITQMGSAQMYGRSITRYEVIAPTDATPADVQAEVRKQYPTVNTYTGTNSVQNFAAVAAPGSLPGSWKPNGKYQFEYHSEY